MKTIISTFFFCLLSFIMTHLAMMLTVIVSTFYLLPPAFCQQVPLYSQYHFIPSLYNPAYSGNNELANLNLLYRMQWKLMPGSPSTALITADAPVKDKKTGLGLTLFNDKWGTIEKSAIYGSYAYRANFKEDIYLLMGLQFGIIDQRINLSLYSEQAITDPALIFNSKREIAPDANLGFGFYCKGLDFGVAFPQLIGNKLTFNDDTTNMFYKLSRHYTGSLKYTLQFGKDKKLALVPVFLTRFVPNTPFQFDGGLLFGFNNQYWLGAVYKSNYAVGINARILFANKFHMGYSYEYVINEIAGNVGLSHEISLGYMFNPKGGSKADMDTLLEQLFSAGNLQYDYAIKKADSLFKNGDYYEAMLNYQAALSYKPNSPYAQQQLMKVNNLLDSLYHNAITEADSLVKAGKYMKARDKYREALKYRPNASYAQEKLDQIENKYTASYRAAIAAADLYFEDKKYGLAKKMYEKALQLNPDDPYVKERLQELEKKATVWAGYDRHIQTADSLYMAGKLDDAMNEYKKALELDPSDAYAIDMISQIKNKKEGGTGESVRLYTNEEFVDLNGQPVEKGYYVVIASFKNIENAKRAINKKAVGVVFSKKSKYYYCYTNRDDTYKGAKESKKKLKDEVPDIWTFILK
ncbi:MAG: PorP/SprF family type IX secretion system membrane protein [Bacteroidetes bacterium]|nr:PorP/SprF family type IX secretion system membrane protein [Bacteroidota bacterium]